VSEVHDKLRAYRDSTIDKWNSKTRIAGGKVNNKVLSCYYICVLK